MSRRQKRIAPRYLRDQKYRNFVVQKFRNIMILSGKKIASYKILYEVIEEISSLRIPVQIIEKAARKVRPTVILKSRRLGGATHQIPVRLENNKGMRIGIRWILAAARSRGEIKIKDRMKVELFDAVRGNGGAIRKREEITRIAESNQAFIREI